MRQSAISPAFRLGMGLVALVVGITLAAELFGFIADQTKLAMNARMKICETLAVQLSLGAVRNDTGMIQAMLD